MENHSERHDSLDLGSKQKPFQNRLQSLVKASCVTFLSVDVGLENETYSDSECPKSVSNRLHFMRYLSDNFNCLPSILFVLLTCSTDTCEQETSQHKTTNGNPTLLSVLATSLQSQRTKRQVCLFNLHRNWWTHVGTWVSHYRLREIVFVLRQWHRSKK